MVKSDTIRIQPTLTPDPPHINVTVVGLEERRAIEKITCDLINKRDRYVITCDLINKRDRYVITCDLINKRDRYVMKTWVSMYL